jgi:hypothetical protein
VRILAHVQRDAKTIPLFSLTNIKRLNLQIKSGTECLTMTKVEEKLVAKLGINVPVYNRNIPVP